MSNLLGAKGAIQSGVLYTDRRDLYLNANTVSELWGSAIPFTTFSRKLSKKKSADPDFKMFEHRAKWDDMKWQVPSGDSSGTALVAGNSAVTVDYDPATMNGIAPYKGLQVDVYSNSTGAPGTYKGQGVILSVTEADDSVSIKFVHVAAGSPAIAASDWFLVVGHASEEGSGSPEAWADELTTTWNSTGIFKTSVEITGTLYEAALKGGYVNEFARLQTEKRKEHALKLEKAFIFSRRKGGLAAPDHITGTKLSIRTTHGAYNILQDAGQTISTAIGTAATAWKNFSDDSMDIFKYSNDRSIKYVFAGDAYLGKIQELVGDSTTKFLKVHDKAFGFDARELETSYGIMRIIRSPLMTRTSGGIFSSKGIVVDPSSIHHVTYRKRKYQTAIHENDFDGQKDQYFADEGIAMTLPERSFVHDFSG